MSEQPADAIRLVVPEDVARVRQAVRTLMQDARFSTVQQTRMVTAASELARNAVVHGGGGRARLQLLTDGARTGVRVVVGDDGPGIGDVSLALRDGYSTAGGLGLGLGGARRLVPDFALESAVGQGTRATITVWR